VGKFYKQLHRNQMLTYFVSWLSYKKTTSAIIISGKVNGHE